MNKKPGSWIFLSHSSRDIEKVRMVRNEFEKLGQNPLAFHLKCMKTDTVDNQTVLIDLIQREIEARNWFVYCESKAAKQSRYVQLEREFVSSLGNKQVWRLNLEQPTTKILKEVQTICSRMQVFLSYSYKDCDLAKCLVGKLKAYDFAVWYDATLEFGDDWAQTVEQKIVRTIKQGFVLGLVTPNSMISNMLDELAYAKQQGATVVLVNVDNALDAVPQLVGLVRPWQLIGCAANPEGMQKVADALVRQSFEQ